MSLEIIHYPHPTLRHRSKPIKKVDAELRAIVAEMFELMYKHEGVGLAANQVNLPYRLFVTNDEGDPKIKEAECVFINPVLSKGRGQVEDEEGCLSIPDVRAPVVRKETIHVQAYDLQGNEIEGDINGFAGPHPAARDGSLRRHALHRSASPPAQLADIKDDLYEFELNFQSRRETGEMPSDEAIAARLKELEQLRTLRTDPSPRLLMRLVMLGTGPFAVPTLEALAASPHEVVHVVTRPPRGRVAQASPHAASRRVARPPGLVTRKREPPRIADCASNRSRPTCSSSATTARSCKSETLATTRLGGINLHGSLLPKYRGAAPVQWAILRGEAETGNSVIQMTPGLDAGPCLGQQRTPIDPDEDAAALEARLAQWVPSWS